MPCLVNTKMRDTIASIAQEYYLFDGELLTAATDQVAKLNQTLPHAFLTPNKTIILPDSATISACTTNFEAIGLAPELPYRNNDPLNSLIDTGMGNEFLAAMEIMEWLSANSASKAAFGGALGAASSLHQKFLQEHTN